MARDSRAWGNMHASRGATLLALRRGPEALADLSTAVESLTRALGPTHRITLSARLNRALALATVGRTEEARAEIGALEALPEAHHAESVPGVDRREDRPPRWAPGRSGSPAAPGPRAAAGRSGPAVVPDAHPGGDAAWRSSASASPHGPRASPGWPRARRDRAARGDAAPRRGLGRARPGAPRRGSEQRVARRIPTRGRVLATLRPHEPRGRRGGPGAGDGAGAEWGAPGPSVSPQRRSFPRGAALAAGPSEALPPPEASDGRVLQSVRSDNRRASRGCPGCPDRFPSLPAEVAHGRSDVSQVGGRRFCSPHRLRLRRCGPSVSATGVNFRNDHRSGGRHGEWVPLARRW